MVKFKTLLIAASLAFAATASAQEPERIVLNVQAGSILTSTGGEFVTAEDGKQLSNGEQLQINPGSVARVVFDRGTTDPDDDCTIVYDKAGVYPVPNDCKRAAAWIQQSGGFSKAAMIAGGAVLIAVLLNNDGGDDPVSPPQSLGNR